MNLTQQHNPYKAHAGFILFTAGQKALPYLLAGKEMILISTKFQVLRVMAGSLAPETSVARKEIIPSEFKKLHGFSIHVDLDCHVSINGGEYIYIPARQKVEYFDGEVVSCSIQESGVPYRWYASYNIVWEVD